MILSNIFRISGVIILALLSRSNALAQMESPQTFSYQGRLMNAAGTFPLTGPADFKFQILDPSKTCLLYEEQQLAVNLGLTGNFSLTVGSAVGAGKRTATDVAIPSLAMANIFANPNPAWIPTPAATLAAGGTCPGGYTPSVGDIRYLRVTVTQGAPVTLSPDQAINSVPQATVAETLQGIGPLGFVQITATVTQANIGILTSGAASDASALHNHDTHNDVRYARLGATDNFTGNIDTTGQIGVGTVAPSADLDIEKPNPSIRVGGTAAAGNATRIDFFGSGSQQASIQSQDNLNVLKFYTGSTLAMSIDNNQVAHFGSIMLTGTENLGKYTNAQEISAPFVAALTPAAEGMMWENTNLHQLRYWDGTTIQSIASTANSVTSVTAGTGITMGGTPTAPTVSVNYGTAAGTAIQGNASFGGDASGTYNLLTVTGIQGRAIAAAVPNPGDALLWNNGTSKWTPTAIVSAAGGANTQIQYNNANAFAGSTDFVWDNANHGLIVDTTNPPVGNAFSILQKPTLSATNSLVQLGAPSIAAGSAQGTFIGANPAAFTGDFVRLQVGGATKYTIESSGTPGTGTDLANKGYVDAQAAAGGGNFLKKDGTVNLTADWAASASNLFKITGLKDPTLAQDAATKNYVDTQTTNTNYLLKAGGTMAGTLNLATNGLVAGTNQLVIAGGNVGVGTAAPTAAGLQVSSAGLASISGEKLDGTWFTGGTSTTTKPQLLVEPAGTSSTTWSTNGTGIGINATAGFTGNLIDAQLNGVSKFSVDKNGVVTGNGSGLTGVLPVAAGLDKQVQFNNSTAMSGSANFIWDTAANKLAVGTSGLTGVLNIGKQAATDVMISAKSINGGIGDPGRFIQYVSSAGGDIFYVDGTGSVFANAAGASVYASSGGGFILGGSWGSWKAALTNTELQTGYGIKIDNATIPLTNTNPGTGVFMDVQPTVNQSGVNGYTALNVNVTETATGSGAKYLLTLGVGGTPKFSVDTAGNVGIGTTSPAGVLHVQNTSGASGIPILERSLGAAGNFSWNTAKIRATTTSAMGDGFGPGFTFEAQDAGGLNKIGEIDVIRSGANNSGAMTLSPYNAGTQVNAMTLMPSGNVGIGTTNPSTKLHVTGNIYAEGNGAQVISGFNNGYMVMREGNPATLRTWEGMQFIVNDGAPITAMSIDKTTGNVGIGTPTPGAILDVASTGIASAIIVPRDITANRPTVLVNGMMRYNTTTALFEFYQAGGWVNFTPVSDARLKTNVEPVTNALGIVEQLKPVYFDWDQKNPRAKSFGTKHQVGFLAQDVEKVLPEVVNQGEDTYRTLEYGKMVSVAIAAIKELYDKVIGHDEAITSLITDNATKDRKIQSLEQDNAEIKARESALEAWACSQTTKPAFCK